MGGAINALTDDPDIVIGKSSTKQELQEYHNHPATHYAKGEKGTTRAQAFKELPGTFDDAMKKAKTAETTKSAAPAPVPTK